MSDLNRAYLEQYLLDRPIANLRDLQYTYGVISVAASDVDHEDVAALTPAANRHLFDEENSVVAVKVDFTGEEPTYEGIEVSQYGANRVADLAHSQKDAARGADHSITHLVGKGPSVEKVKKYAMNRLTKWPTDEKVVAAADEHEEGHLITGLAELGERNGLEDEVLADLEAALPDGTDQPLVTVKVKRELDGEYEWPGNIDVYNFAMVERKKKEAADKSSFSEYAIGQGVDYVTGDEGDVVGVSSSPLQHYKTKQQSAFQGLSAEESSWLDHPITYETSLHIGRASDFIDDSYENVFQQRVYFLPYPRGVVTPEKAEELYDIFTDVRARLDSDDEEFSGRAASNYVQQISEMESVNSRDYLYYVVMLEFDQANLFNFRAELPSVPQLWFEELAKTHNGLIEDSSPRLVHSFDETGVFRSAVQYDDDAEEEDDDDDGDSDTFQLVDARPAVSTTVRWIAGGWYTTVDMPQPEEYTESDYRARLYESILEQQPIDAQQLLEQQVRHLVAEEGDQFPERAVANQWLRLVTLRSVGLLRARDPTLVEQDIFIPSEQLSDMDERDSGSITSDSVEETTSDVPATYGEAVENTLDEFVSAAPSLRDNPERHAVFAVGAMVGAISEYQSRVRGVSERLVDKHPVSRMGPQRLQQVFTEGLDKAVTYARDNDKDADIVQSTYVEHAQDALSKVDIDSMTLSDADVKYHYALGVSYALNVYVEYGEEEEE